MVGSVGGGWRVVMRKRWLQELDSWASRRTLKSRSLESLGDRRGWMDSWSHLIGLSLLFSLLERRPLFWASGWTDSKECDLTSLKTRNVGSGLRWENAEGASHEPQNAAFFWAKGGWTRSHLTVSQRRALERRSGGGAEGKVGKSMAVLDQRVVGQKG
jgi:hypothetical protein